jgi:hypothetical protein
MHVSKDTLAIILYVASLQSAAVYAYSLKPLIGYTFSWSH